jgi:DNA recombination protein RmuC
MNPISIILFSLAIIVVAGIVSFFVRQAFKQRLMELQARGDLLDGQLKESLLTRAAAEQKSSRIPELENHIEQLQNEKSELLKENAALKQQQESDTEKIQWSENYRQQLKDAFAALSSEALKTNAEAYLNQAKEKFEDILRIVKSDWGTHKEELKGMVGPLDEALKNLNKYSQEIEAKREGAYSGIQEQLRQLADAQGQLQNTTTTLIQALRAPGVRGKWGEEQLRRIVELVGMLNYVDFEEQVSTEDGRPDMIVHLPNTGILPVDAKTPMTSYLEAMSSTDEALRRVKLAEHAGVMRQRIKDLGSKAYWKQFERTPEVVVMFIPNDGCIGAAFEQNPDLFEFAVKNGVIITSPFTLYALLKSVAYGWQQHQVAENARLIAQESKLLYDRLIIFISHWKDIGGGLKRAVDSFNDSIGSFNRRVLPVARRLNEMGVSGNELESPDTLEIAPHLLDIPESKDTQ